MKNKNLTHLHVHFGGAVATVGMLTAQAWGFTYSMTLHGPDEFYDVEAFYLPRKIEHASFIFCISDYCRSQVMKYCNPSTWSKLHVLRLGVDINEFTAPPKTPAIANETALQLVCIGRLVPAKGQQILLHALTHLLSRGFHLRLTFVGDGPDRPSLEAFVSANELQSQVTFAGALNHDQTRRTLEKADIFILASFAEGIPVSLMEAMAMELPCVSTYVAGIPELIRDNENGILVPPSSTSALADAISRLALDSDLRLRLGKAARESVSQYYNLATNVAALADKFDQCLRGKSS